MSTAGSKGGVPQRLRRDLGTGGAVMLGLGSIIGTGVFVSIGVAAGIAGPAVIVAIGLAALVVTCNGLSSAQLAASHPVSGGTYEYGYRYASPLLGFLAGWMFLCAKSASAATAALGLTGYLLNIFGRDLGGYSVLISITIVTVLTVIILTGIRRTNRMNITIVSVTLISLAFFVFSGLPGALREGSRNLTPFFSSDLENGGGPFVNLLHATALMFVAYTGYGRIATMGEEVRNPRETIPRAIILTLTISMALYIVVGVVGIANVGTNIFFSATTEKAATLKIVAMSFGFPGATWVLVLGALTAMTGVTLNLILGLSRVLLAMGRRRDLPGVVARLDRSGSTPYVAVILTGMIIAVLVLLGNVRTTWSFSAFTVLIYYAITNFCALRLPKDKRLYHRWIAVVGLVACLALAFFVEGRILLVGLGLIVLGSIWHLCARRIGVR